MNYPNLFSPEFWIIVRALKRPKRWALEKMVHAEFWDLHDMHKWGNLGEKNSWLQALHACWDFVCPTFVNKTDASRVKITQEGLRYIEKCKNLSAEQLAPLIEHQITSFIFYRKMTSRDRELRRYPAAWIDLEIVKSTVPLRFTEKGQKILQICAPKLIKNIDPEYRLDDSLDVLIQNIPKQDWGSLLPQMQEGQAKLVAERLRGIREICPTLS